ncbi:uncharacterized protein LOC117301103 [Asterias rubens]|uniref:uncharacterized protein LOC117301103 n=1 Tax=Asterias rubens TaxID=7604 RepID=UPI0014559B5F|nr:uncharacterized protein LOC117301103 [Asterias rubens]
MTNQGGHSGPGHGGGAGHHHHHAPHATHAQVLAQHMNQHVALSNEVTKFLKVNLKIPKALPYAPDHIQQRTSTTCVPDTEYEWNEQFSRRQHHLSKGFFTPQQVTYEPIGDVVLESRHLVFKVFADCLPKKVHTAAFFVGNNKFGFTPPKTADKSELSSKPRTPGAGDKSLSGRVSQLNEDGVSSAGYTYIKKYLKESEKILVAERGGQTFEKCVQKLEDAKKQHENTGTQQHTVTFRPPANLPQGDAILALSSSQYSQARAASGMSTESMKSDSSLKTKSKTQPIDETDDEDELLRLNFLRNYKAITEKLQAVHRVLNALHNMKTKDLRSRVPLSHEMVKFLYRHVPYERPAYSRLARTTGRQMSVAAPMGLIQSSDTVSSSDLYPTAATNMSSNKWTSKSHLSNKSSVMSKPNELPPLSSTPVQWRKFRQNLPSLHHKPRPSDKEHRLETWEDLLAVPTSNMTGNQQTHRFSVQGPGHITPHSFGFNKWPNVQHRHHPDPHHHHSHHPPHHHHHQTTSRQPYWMTAAVSSADKVKRMAQSSGSGSQMESQDPERTLETLKENFQEVQEKMAREAVTDIERMERERCRTFRQKFYAANEHPVMELAVKHMREAPQISRQLAMAEDSDLKEIKPSKWYIDLKAEAVNIAGPDDHIIHDLLQKLVRWSLEDAKSVPNAKEKLCLLVMSMPASELLTIAMQQAVQFVLDHILWASHNSFSQWLHHRKIPLITQTVATIH